MYQKKEFHLNIMETNFQPLSKSPMSEPYWIRTSDPYPVKVVL
jgi:hypothetical protein